MAKSRFGSKLEQGRFWGFFVVVFGFCIRGGQLSLSLSYHQNKLLKIHSLRRELYFGSRFGNFGPWSTGSNAEITWGLGPTQEKSHLSQGGQEAESREEAWKEHSSNSKSAGRSTPMIQSPSTPELFGGYFRSES